MESFLPAKNYINLGYEITRSILGLGHPRTLYIKSNLSKLSQLSFNKEVIFKTLQKIPALTQLIQNPKRAKKKKLSKIRFLELTIVTRLSKYSELLLLLFCLPVTISNRRTPKL